MILVNNNLNSFEFSQNFKAFYKFSDYLMVEVR